MHVCLFNIKRSISRHRLSFPKDTFPPASRREEIFYIPAREEKQVMNRYNIPGMAFLKFVTPCKILLCGYCVFSLVSKLLRPAVIFQFFFREKKNKIPPSGHWSQMLHPHRLKVPFISRRPFYWFTFLADRGFLGQGVEINQSQQQKGPCQIAVKFILPWLVFLQD